MAVEGDQLVNRDHYLGENLVAFSVVLREEELEAACRAQELRGSCNGHRLWGKRPVMGAGSI